MKGEFLYANAFTIGLVRRLCRFYFGEFFLKAEKDSPNLKFDIYLRDKIIGEDKKVYALKDTIDVDYFNEYWNESIQNPAWYLIIVNVPLKQIEI